MKTLLAALSIALTIAPLDCGGSAHAQSPTAAQDSQQARRLAYEIVRLMNGEKRWETGIDPLSMVVAVSAANEIEQSSNTEMKKAIATLPGGKDRFLKIVAESFAKYLRAQSAHIRDQAATIYSQNFTVSEMTEIVAFLGTPVGLKWMNHMSQFEGALGSAFDKDQKLAEQAMSSAFAQVKMEADQASHQTKSEK